MKPFAVLKTLALALAVTAAAFSGLDTRAAEAEDGGTETPALVNEPERLVEIRVEGARRVEVEAVKRALKTKVGNVFDRTKTAEDLKSLWSLNYFSDLQLLVQHVPKGIVYVVRVEEKPAIREVKLEGNDELSKDDFKEAIDIKVHSILDLDAVRRNVKKIHDKYIDKGFFLAEVTYRIDPVTSSNEADVVFVIREHSKVLVKQITFINNQRVPSVDLKDVMATKEGGFLSFITGEGTYREELFQRDLSVITGLYYDRGYVNVKVDKPAVTITPDKRFIYITIRVEEGDQFRIGTMDFSGDLLRPTGELRKFVSASEGEIFNRSKLFKDISALTDVYYDEGYAYANITPGTNIHADTRVIDLTFEIQKGKQVYIERIDLKGNTKTRDKVIRREMRIYEGDLFSGTNIKLSKARVTALGYFETVEVTHKPGSDDQKVVVLVEIKEKATGTFQIGLGFSSIENFVFTAQVSQNNFLGWGNTVSASAQLSSLRQFAQLSYWDPYFFDTNFIFSSDIYLTQLDYFGFIRDSRGGDVSLGYHLPPWWFFDEVQATVTYTREWVRIEAGGRGAADLNLANSSRSGQISSIKGALTWDKRDNRLFPSKGMFHLISAEYAPSFIGGSFLFARYSENTRFYIPIIWGFIFKLNANFGVIQQLSSDSPIPLSELYKAGGINSVRGYFLRSISPTVLVNQVAQPDASPVSFGVGGDKQAIFNFELEFTIIEKVGIRGVIFADAGNVYSRDERFFQDKQNNLPLGMFWSVGAGLRWFSPIGPLRFEWGIPLNKRPFDQPVDFEFTIGNFF